MAMAQHNNHNHTAQQSQQSSASSKKVPMSPSEFFAKIYGTPANNSSTSSNTTTTTVDTDESVQQQRGTITSTWHLYPPWNAADPLFWASSGINRGTYFNPLSLPPALTALSK
jgi:hypothetical protein